MKKLFAALLIIALAFMPVLASCSEGGSKSAGTGASSSVTETEAQTEPEFEKADYGGYIYRIIAPDRSNEPDWKSEFVSETVTGEPIEDAVYQRNILVEEKYNVNIEHIPVKDTELVSTVSKNINSGDDAFDIIISNLFDMTDITEAGSLLDINTLDNIDLNKSWWDQSSVRDLSIGHKQYFVTGDIDYRSYTASWIYLFSKTLVDNYNLEDPYEFVKNGTWTIDKFISMTTGVAGDVNGDGAMDDSDRYGLITESYNSLGMFFGAGCVVIDKDENDMPVIAVNTSRGEEVVTKVLELMNDPNSTANINQPYYDYDWTKLDAVFGDERGLFYSIVLSTVMRIREADTDFGIIPMPKYDEEQKEYCTWVSPFIANAVGVPVTCVDSNRSAVVCEYLGYTSGQTIKPAVYDVTLQRKLVRDDQSSSMLDLIFTNRIYDLGSIYDWGGVGTFIPNLSFQKGVNFASKYASLESAAQTALAVTIEGYQKIAA